MSPCNYSPLRSIVAAIVLLVSAAAQAAVSVGPGGSTGVLTFDTAPAASEFATFVLTGGAATYLDPAGMDAGAQTVNAALVINTLPTSATVPPSTFAGGFRYNTAERFLQSRPTTSGTNAANTMVATLQNNSGGDLTEVTVSYDLAVFNVVAEEIPGFRVFWSLSGAPGSWTLLPNLSGNETAGPHTDGLGTTVWPAGALLYLLWADDNDDGLADGSLTIDNFVVSGISTVVTPIAITNQPQSITVGERDPATFTVQASGSPQRFYWYRDGVLIEGANQTSYTIPSALYPADNGAQFHVVISNSFGIVTSDPANLTVLPDTNGPTVVSVVGELAPDVVTVTFSEPVDPNTISTGTIFVHLTGTDPFNGLITTGFTISTNNRTIIFTTDPRASGSNYSVYVTGVLDLSFSQNPLDPDPTIVPLPQTIQLIGFDTNNEWKYDINNGDRFGTGWETVGYDDSAWLLGQAGLGLDSSANGVPIVTPLPYLADSAPVYFRRHFLLPSGTNGVVLTLRDVVEDGAVYYINGQEAFRHNVNPGTLTFATRAAANQTDPTPIQGPFNLPTTNLVPGDNVIAAVVIQSGNTSSDIELAVELTATIPAFSVGPPIINGLPQSQTVNERQSVTLTVVAEGAVPLSYQWRKNGSDILGANAASYTINSVLPFDEGSYDVAISNAHGSTNSPAALLTVIPDTTPPTFISAVGRTNLTEVLLTFSEPLDIDTAEDVGLYTMQLTAGGGALTIAGATLTNATNILITTSPRIEGEEYTITLAGVVDRAVARNEVVPPSRPVRAQVVVLAPDDFTMWRYESSSNNLDGVNWQLPAFDDSAWPAALAGFTTSNNLEITTNGFDLRSTNMLAPNVGGPATAYYRVPFNFPGSVANAALHIVGVVDDGLVAYINGIEAGRLRITNASPVSFTNLATASGPEASNVHLPLETITLTNLSGLVSGQNLLAIELHQNSATSSDAVLSVQLVAEVEQFSGGGTTPRLNITRDGITGEITIRWSGSGTLQETADLQSPTAQWTAVPGNPNPYVFTPTGDRRFFSLRP
jgi:hypothetical protein